MPQKFKPYQNEMDDGRRRIPKSKYEEVRQVYTELQSQRKTAEAFKCSRRLVVLILHPEKYKEVLKQRKEAKAHKTYYDRAKHTIAIQKYRKKKRAMGFGSFKNTSGKI